MTNNIHPVKTPADLKPMHTAVINGLGANTAQMQWSVTFPALQQGIVEGQEDPIGAVIIPQRVHEVQKYLMTYSYNPLFLGISSACRRYPRAKVQKAADGGPMAYQIEISRKGIADGVALLRGRVMALYEPSSDELAAFKAATKPSFHEWVARIAPEIVDLFVTEAQGKNDTLAAEPV